MSNPTETGQSQTPFAAASGSALPCGMTRDECVRSLWSLVMMAENAERAKHPEFLRWPDLDALVEFIEDQGFPARK